MASQVFGGANRAQRKRVLLTGASGLLGRQVLKQLEQDGWKVRGLCSSRCKGNLVKCDLTAEGDVERQLLDFCPDIVVHMAAERRPDVCHKSADVASKINVDATSSLAKACHTAGAWLIYVSTDYVFDGRSPPFAVDALPNPQSEYGQQKLEGERVTLQECPTAAVLRVPLLYGHMEYLKESGVTALLTDLQNGTMKTADHFQKRYPTYTKDVARVMSKMMEVHCQGKSLQGRFHWQADESLTKFEMVQIIAELQHLDASGVSPNTCPPRYPCPEDNRLDCSRLTQELDIDPLQFRTPIREALLESFQDFAMNVQSMDSPIKAVVVKTDTTHVDVPVKLGQTPLWSCLYKDLRCAPQDVEQALMPEAMQEIRRSKIRRISEDLSKLALTQVAV
jgi:dTDP-4-dehydrorhamnose reductase